MNIHIYNLFYICTGTHACMGFVPDNKLIRIRIPYSVSRYLVSVFSYEGLSVARAFCNHRTQYRDGSLAGHDADVFGV